MKMAIFKKTPFHFKGLKYLIYNSKGRNSHMCGRIIKDADSGILVTIVVGGYITGDVPITSVEILDESGITWKLGPSLPVPVRNLLFLFIYLKQTHTFTTNNYKIDKSLKCGK